MYIKKVVIENIRSISHFEMEFPKPAGWHVLIGDNGSGKTSVLQAMALVISDSLEVADVSFFSRLYTTNWLAYGQDSSEIILEIEGDLEADDHSGYDDNLKGRMNLITNTNSLNRQDLEITKKHWATSSNHLSFLSFLKNKKQKEINQSIKPIKEERNIVKFGWFSASFGPFRRFKGDDDSNISNIELNAPRFSPHVSLFKEDIVLKEALIWLKELDRRRLKEKEENEIQGVKEASAQYIPESEIILQSLKKLINKSGLLSNNAQFDSIDIDGEPVFMEPNGMRIKASQMSSGYQAILGLAFELIRQLIRVYPAKDVFEDIEKGNMQISLPGVVLIDEIDAHLHPTWQTRIGHWFTQYFPNLQFIVTTHSPLICRACEKGSIWRLAAPGSEMPSGEITGIDKDRLIYGNILDAYGTEVFGSDPVRSKQSHDKLERLGRLNMLSVLGKIKPEEEKERRKLQKILATDDPTGF